jgi:hypothetical protein
VISVAVFRRASNVDRDLVVRVVDDALRAYGLGVLRDSSDLAYRLDIADTS